MLGEPALNGRVVIVTGAASGLGRASAVALAKAGASLTLTDYDAAGLEETAATIRAGGGSAHTFAADVADAAACATIVEQAVAHWGSLYALCNVAGVLNLQHSADVSPDRWDKVFAVNVRAPFFLFQAALPHLKQSEGRVLNVASASAAFGHSYLAPYAASKAALVNLTQSLAMEYILSTGIRINAILPGGMATPMAANTTFPEGIDVNLMARYGPLRGLNTPEEFTDMIVYLCSPACTAFHGACISMDNGITAG